MTDIETENLIRARKRLLGFGAHLVGYFIAVAAILLFNFLEGVGPGRMVFPIVAWGSVLALHAAFVMGLFNIFFERRD